MVERGQFGRVNSAGTSLVATLRTWHPHYVKRASEAVATRAAERAAGRLVPLARQRAAEPRPYTRFVILSAMRSGTTYLVRSLDAHPQIVCHAEIAAPFAGRDGSELLSKEWAGPLPDGARVAWHGDPVGLFAHMVWPPEHDASAIGFKLFADHGRGPMRVVFPYLQAVADLRVIRLTREDRLAQAVSHFRARRDQFWHAERAERYAPEPVHVPAWKLEAHFQRMDRSDQVLASLGRDRPSLETTYEQLTAGPDVLAEVQRFVGVEPSLSTEAANIRKIATRSVREDLDNFDELASAFHGTRWAQYFERHV